MTKQLLFTLNSKDFDVQTFRAGGPGGQNQNKRETGVRIIHKASGAFAEAREERSQRQNKKSALERLSQTIEFKRWLNAVVQEMLSGESVDQVVDKQMRPENIRIEIVSTDGRWVES